MKRKLPKGSKRIAEVYKAAIEKYPVASSIEFICRYDGESGNYDMFIVVDQEQMEGIFSEYYNEGLSQLRDHIISRTKEETSSAKRIKI